MRKIKKIVLSFLGLILFYGGYKFFTLSNLKPEVALYPNSYKKAKTVLEEMGVAHGIQVWDTIATYNSIYEDEFYGFLGEQSHPFKEQKIKFSLSYIPQTFHGQLHILTGKEEGTIWGIQSGKVYKKVAKDVISLKGNKDMKFWIPTYQYFIELPSRIQEATALEYLGKKKIKGIEVEGVLASWGTVEPQRDIDQYVVWIAIKTKRIVKVEYTVRDMYAFVSGGAYFNNYKNYNGLLLPTELPVESNLLSEGYLHKMSIKDFKINAYSKESLLPLN